MFRSVSVILLVSVSDSFALQYDQAFQHLPFPIRVVANALHYLTVQSFEIQLLLVFNYQLLNIVVVDANVNISILIFFFF